MKMLCSIAGTCAAILCGIAAGCGSGDMGPTDGCRSLASVTVTYSGPTEVLAYLRSPNVHDGSGPGLVRFVQGSDSTCTAAPATANVGKITMVLNQNAPDPIQVFMGGTFISDGLLGNIPVTGSVTRTAVGDSVVYVSVIAGPADVAQYVLSGQLQFAPASSTLDDDLRE